MGKTRTGHMRWTVDTLIKIAAEYDTLKDFRENNVNAYHATLRCPNMAHIVGHMKRDRVHRTDEELRIEALKYRGRKEFQINAHAMYEAARIRGILGEICKHMMSRKELIKGNKNGRIWTLDKIAETALKFNSRTEFKYKSKGAYRAAYKMGVMDQVCSHMEIKNKQWKNDEILTAALSFDSRKAFQKGNRKASDLAYKRGIIDKACSHMKFSTRVSNMERELLKEIRKLFPDSKTFHDPKVNIPGKPHIKRFEVDIFIIELNKGIEFDGTYHHSMQGLRRGRLHWSDEDILNYHEIKDGYFLSKGIQILHVKEEDWIKDKEECVKKCLEFLSKR